MGIQRLHGFTAKHNSDSVETCPQQQSLFALGTYELVDPNAQKRDGSVSLYRLCGDEPP
jgi:hypothetical protein